MWNRENRKRFIVTAVMVCTVGLGLTGCMGVEKSENSMQELEEEIPGNDNTAGEDAGDKQDGDNPGDSADGEDGSHADRGTEENIEGSDGMAENEPGNADAPVSGQTELLGDICEIGDMQFKVNEITVTKDEAGGTEEVMVMGAPGDGSVEPITVVYDENTVFTKQTIWDMGARHEEKEATAAELEKELIAEMKGSYEGEKFHASEVKIVEVVRDE